MYRSQRLRIKSQKEASPSDFIQKRKPKRREFDSSIDVSKKRTRRILNEKENIQNVEEVIETLKKRQKVIDEDHLIQTKQKPNPFYEFNNQYSQKGKKRPWSENEDNLLIKLVQLHGPQKWTFIAEHLPGRIGKQCRERWHNHLNPKIKKSHWGDYEEWVLFLSHRVMGNRWAEMAKQLIGRTDNSIKNHWNSAMKKRISEMEERLKDIRKRGGISNQELLNSFTSLEKSLITKLLSVPQQMSQNDNSHNSPVIRKRMHKSTSSSQCTYLHPSSVNQYMIKLTNEIKLDGIELENMFQKIRKRQGKISQSIFWEEEKLEDIQNNLYDYILSKVDHQIGIDSEEKVDRWIKNFWVMCQDVFTVSAIKDFIAQRPQFYYTYLHKFTKNDSNQIQKNLSRLYDNESQINQDYQLPALNSLYKTPLKERNNDDVSISPCVQMFFHNSMEKFEHQQQLQLQKSERVCEFSEQKKNHEVQPNEEQQQPRQNQHIESPSKLLNLLTPKQQNHRNNSNHKKNVTPINFKMHEEKMSISKYERTPPPSQQLFSNFLLPKHNSSFKLFQSNNK